MKSKPAHFDGARREEKTSAYFVRNDDNEGESEVPGAKPAPGAPSDSKTHPCKNQMRKDGAPSESLYFGLSCRVFNETWKNKPQAGRKSRRRLELRRG